MKLKILPYDHLNFFPTEMVGKTNSGYHINKDNNVQAKLSASQYGFRAGVSTETALHELVHRLEHCVVRKKPALSFFFFDIVGAFNNFIFHGFVAALRGLGMSKIFTLWIENLLRHCTVQVEITYMMINLKGK